MIPIGDHPNPRGFPLVNWLLIGLNVAIFLLVSWPLMQRLPDLNDPRTLEYIEIVSRTIGQHPEVVARSMSAYDVFVYLHGYRPIAPETGDLFFSMFLHAGWMHLAFNMLFLWIYGDNVEHRMGRVGYLAAYLSAGIAANWTHAFFTPDPGLPAVGASGAISGVLGFYFIWFPRNVVKVFVFLFPFFMDVVLLPARWVLGIYLIFDNILPFLLARDSGGVAHGAHIGGFVAGVALAVVLGRFRTFQAMRHFEAGAPRMPGSAGQIVEAAQGGRWREAAGQLLRLPRGSGSAVAPRVWLDTAAWLAQNATPDVAASLYRRYLVEHPQGPSLDEANLGLGLLLLQHGQPIAAYQYLLTAIDLAESPQVAARAREAVGVIQDLQRRRRQLS